MNLQVTDLPPALGRQLEHQNVIVFDGECVLCAGFFRFVLRHDRKRVFQFATAQSPFGQTLYGALTLDTRDFQTNLVVHKGCVLMQLDTVATVMGALGWPWKIVSGARWVPDIIGGPMYRLIAHKC